MKPISLILKGAASAAMLFAFTMAADAAEKVRIALGDVVSVETLAFAVAMERAKDRGVDYEITSFAKEELSIQSMINGQSDIGVGTPYSVIQKSKLPLKNIYQMSRLVFFPVVSKEYKTWKDLDGQPFAFHARGTGTEAIGNIIAKREGIKFGDRSYVPGSENRIIAMMNGQIKASIVDLANKNLLMSKAGDRFQVAMPSSGSSARISTAAGVPSASVTTLTKAMGISLAHNETDLLGDRLYIEDRDIRVGRIAWATRIGISVGTDRRWRAYVVGCESVSGRKGAEKRSSISKPIRERRRL